MLELRGVQAGADQGRATAGRTTVLVGDGASDYKAALLADVVFAKGAPRVVVRRSPTWPIKRFERLADVQHALGL